MSEIKPDSTEDMQLRHLLWMYYNMPQREDNPFKWNRWLGFIQGALWALRLLTITQCKDENKKSLNNGWEKCFGPIANELSAIHNLGDKSPKFLMKRKEDTP